MMTMNVSVVPSQGTWVVRAGGAVLGESGRALELVEGDRPAVIYFPREDVGMEFLEPSGRQLESERLGDAHFFGIVTRSTVIENAAWSYAAPKPPAERIAGFLAFDTEKVTVEQL
jgi:uncharacterized protein (DUF427 family)